MEAAYSLQLLGSPIRLQQYMRQLPNAVLLVDRTGMIVEVNEILLRATGFAREELIGRPFRLIVPGKGTIRQFYEQMLEKEVQNSLPVELEWRNKHGKSGTSNAMVLVQESEDPLYMIHLFQLEREHGHLLAQRFFQRLGNDNSLGFIMIDATGDIVEINQLACRVLGVEKISVINRNLDDVFARVPESHRLIQRDLLTGVKQQNNAMYWTNNNQRFELLVDSGTLQDESGQTVGGYILFKDITNLRSIEQKIERNERLAMIGQIAAGTAHEIRNPLTSIKGFLQMFSQLFQDIGMEREKSYTEIMLTEINRINSLVNEFLLLSKPRDVQYSMVDLNTVFEELLPIVESQGLLHGIDVKYSSHGLLPTVVGDAELLKQVFLNICKNGIEAMGNEGTIHISHHFETDGNRLSIDIHDSGPGIPPYVIDKIFDPFYTTKEEGTGLGLAVCQKIIHDIGGQIRVSTKGYGTTFHILLPYM